MASARGSVGDTVRVFLKLGVVGFGGPVAHIALMRDEVVRRRAWVDDETFLDLVGATNLIPGPNSTELAIHLGARRAGWRGLVAAGTCFIAPAVLCVLGLAWLYERHGTDPAALDLRYGILPVVIAVIGHALFGLGRSAVKSRLLAVVATGSAALYVAGVNEILLLAGAALAAALWANRARLAPGLGSIVPLLAVLGGGGGATPKVDAPGLVPLFAVFLKIGSVLYGSGYVLVAFLERDVVRTHHWLTSREVLDAIAVGQVTPGPVFSTATFVGYLVRGFSEAAVATVAIFLPSFVLVALLHRIVPWMRRSPWAASALVGAGAAVGLLHGLAG